MTGLEVGGWFASAFVEKLTEQVRSYIGDQYAYQNTTKIKDKLESLEGNMNEIQAAIHEANQRHIKNEGLKRWLLDLKDACYDAEDVLDSFEYQLLRNKVKEKSQVSGMWEKTKILSKRVLFRDEDLNELFAVADRFGKLVKQMGAFVQLLSLDRGARGKEGELRSTDSDFKEPKLFGRDTEKTRLIELLQEKGGDEVGPSRNYFFNSILYFFNIILYFFKKLGPSREVGPCREVHVLPIVGIGGVGKTTLAQSVYNEQSVKNFFDLTAWVCVSNKWDLRRLMVEIIESARIEKPPDFYHIRSLDRIRQILKKGLIGKRFLLVLDDVWNDKLDKWKELRSALEYGNDGSKVIVTTRSHKIADMMRTKKAISLGGLADKEYWQYFVHCAFGGVCPEHHPNLIFFAEKIVKKLGGLPLAAKVIGAVLKSSLNEKHWKEISESTWWEVDQSKGQIMPVLALSYDYLPAHLKHCFVYCSLFPKDYKFSVRRLVWLWMAQGYIQCKKNKTMENIGDDYFKELLSRSFFEKAKDNSDKYVIHDLLHDLAQYLSHGESFIADDYMSDIKEEDIPKKVRHIYTSANNLSVVCNYKYAKKNLRSLVVSGCRDISLDILEELKGLRVLILDGVRTSSLPECFRKMLHLRYLEIIDLNGYPTLLPQSLGKLYHLQVLALREHIYNGMPEYFLPKGINRLINLRHLYAPTMKISGMGTLTSLQELKFSVEKEKGFEIWQLKDMSQLRELFLQNLVNVESKEQASEARLCSKRNLKKLKLYWGPVSHHRRHGWLHEPPQNLEHLAITGDPGGVLEGLEQPKNLEHLEIKGFNGKCPSWWNRNWQSDLIYIKLDGFSSWEILPPFGHLPLLRELHLYGMNAVKRIGPEFYGSNNTKPFPSLDKLVLKGMSELVEWYKPEGEGIELFPRLYFLEVDGFPKLRGPLCLPSHLKELRVHRWRNFSSSHEEGIYLFGCPSFSRLIEWIPMQNLASLERVEINFDEITSFTTEEEEWFQHLTSLRLLIFNYCKKLQSLPSILSLSTLRILHVGGCPNLQSLPKEGPPASLKNLYLSRCNDDGSLGSHTDPGVVLLGDLEPPQNLERLVIEGFDGKCPSWWNGNWLSDLNYIDLDGFSSWEILPPFGHFPLLRELHLRGMNAVKRIGPEFYGSNNTSTSFPSLEVLVLKGMSELVEWYKPAGEGTELFSRLSVLEVDGCPKLRGPLCLPSHLKKLVVHHCRKTWVKFTREEEGIYLFSCPSFSRLIEWIPMQNLASLERMEINFDEITGFTTEQEEWFQHLTSLQSLSFYDCNKLQSLPSISRLSTLRELGAGGCPSLQSLPEEGLPTSLKKLYLSGIHQVLKERCSEGGLDRHKISHIPEIILKVDEYELSSDGNLSDWE